MEIYNDLASFGRGMAYLRFGISLIILSILLIIAFYLFYLGFESIRTTATIESRISKGVFQVSYNLDGKQKTGTLNGTYMIGDNVQIDYNKKTKEISPHQDYFKNGSILLGIAVIGGIISYGMFYVFTTYKAASAVEGGLSGLRILGDVL